MNESVVKDIKSVISGEKVKRNDKSREIVDIITASVSGPTVEKGRAKVDLAKKNLVYQYDEFPKVLEYALEFSIPNKHPTNISKEKQGQRSCPKRTI